MPNPRKNEKKKEYISRCIPQVIKEGKEQDQAIAICYSMWKEHEKSSKATITYKDGDEELIF